MLDDLSDDDFCETNFCEPSPVKKSTLLPSARERNKQERKKQELRKRILKTEVECFNSIGNSLKAKEQLENVKITQKSSNDVLFSPQCRTFFEPVTISKDDLQPFLWVDFQSQFYEMTLEEFIFHLMQDPSLSAGEDEKNQLTHFCFNILIQENDPVVRNMLVVFLSKQILPYDMIAFKKWGGNSLSCLIPLISKTVSGYTASQARELFREACLAALDPKTFSLSTELQTLISECLVVFTVQYKVSEEIDWLISLSLKPEECFRILEVLPSCGLYADLNLCFAWKILPTILDPKCYYPKEEVVSWQSLVNFLEKNESKIKNLAPNFYFCFMYILKFIVIRIPEHDYNSVGRMLNVIDGLKLHFCIDKGNTLHLSMEALNRLYLICNEILNNDKSFIP